MKVIDIAQLGDAIYEYRDDGYVYCQIAGWEQWHLWLPDKVAPQDWPKVKEAIQN